MTGGGGYSLKMGRKFSYNINYLYVDMFNIPLVCWSNVLATSASPRSGPAAAGEGGDWWPASLPQQSGSLNHAGVLLATLLIPRIHVESIT